MAKTEKKPVIVRFRPTDGPSAYKGRARVIVQHNPSFGDGVLLYTGRVVAHDTDGRTIEVHIEKSLGFAVAYGDGGGSPNWTTVEVDDLPHGITNAKDSELECFPDTKTVRALFRSLHEKIHYIHLHRLKNEHLKGIFAPKVETPNSMTVTLRGSSDYPLPVTATLKGGGNYAEPVAVMMKTKG